MKIFGAIFFIFITGLCFFSGCSSSSKSELHIYSWGDYFKPELIERFEREHNCHVIIDTYDSNEAMYAKIKVGGVAYDLIFPSGYIVEIMQEQGMLLPIDRRAIPNTKYLDPKFLNQSNSSIEQYGIPYLLSLSGVAYRNDKVKITDYSWSVFARKEYKGRMTMLNDVREALGAALKFLGYSINTLDESEVQEAADILIQWKQNLAKFESEQYKSGIANGEYLIVQGYNGDILQVIQDNPKVSFYLPKEGTVIAMDYAVIPQNASHPALAQKFINFLLDPEVAAQTIAHTFFLAPNIGAIEHLPDSLRTNPILFPPQEILDKSEMIRNLGEGTDIYYDAWDHVKAAG
jgi:spermidine/putrescine transport system substrate-binding protein